MPRDESGAREVVAALVRDPARRPDHLDGLRESAEQEARERSRAPTARARAPPLPAPPGSPARRWPLRSHQQRQRDEERRREEPARHEVAADAHDVRRGTARGRARGSRTRRAGRRELHGDGREDHQQRDRIAVERVEQVHEPLVQQLRLGNAGGELGVGGVRKRHAVVDDRKHLPRGERPEPQREPRQRAPPAGRGSRARAARRARADPAGWSR